MTNDMSEHLRKLTSRNGRYWLRDSRNDGQSETGSTEELPFQSRTNQVKAPRMARMPLHESVVVSIPSVENAKPAKPVPTMPEHSPSPAKPGVQLSGNARVAAAAPQTPKPKPKIVIQPKTVVQPDTVSKPVNIATVSAAPTRPKMAVPIATPASKPIPMAEPVPVEPPIDATENNSANRENDDAVEAARATQTREDNDSIVKIADEIINRFPVASPAVVMFVGSQTSLYTDESCARVAAELASRKIGNVLLVDSDFGNGRLTKASGMGTQAGLSEVMNIAFSWEKAVLKSGSSKLDFMPVGTCPHKRWIPKEQLREAVAEMKSSYQFVCVSVGDAHETGASTWSEIADGAFLLVSATNSSEAIAESAVMELRSQGARMVGCIATDVQV